MPDPATAPGIATAEVVDAMQRRALTQFQESVDLHGGHLADDVEMYQAALACGIAAAVAELVARGWLVPLPAPLIRRSTTDA